MNRNDVKILKKYLQRRYVDFHDTSTIHAFKLIGLMNIYPDLALQYQKNVTVNFAQTSKEGVAVYNTYKHKLIPIIGRLFK